MTQATRELRQHATHWAYQGSNGYGGFQFAAPVLIDCRWEDTQVLFRTIDGREVVSRSIVYVADDLEIGDYLGEGDLTETTDPTTISSQAFQVRGYNRVTNLRNMDTTRKAML